MIFKSNTFCWKRENKGNVECSLVAHSPYWLFPFLLVKRRNKWTAGWKLMMTSSNGNIFRVTGHLCGEFTGPRWIPAHRPVTRSFDVFFGLRLAKPLSKQWWGRWFETLSRPLWRHCNVSHIFVWNTSIEESEFKSLSLCFSHQHTLFLYDPIYVLTP